MCRFIFLSLFLIPFLFFSCGLRLQVAERTVRLGGSLWYSKDTIPINFDLPDTATIYKVFLVVKHLHSYKFRNIWLNMQVFAAGDSVSPEENFRLNIELANNEEGWLGSGMGNWYQSYIFWQTLRPKKAGLYHFRITHIMEENPLWGIREVGVRIVRAGKYKIGTRT